MPSPSRSSRHPEASDAAESGVVPRQPKFLTALPVFNEVRHVEEVLDEVLRFTPHVLVVDDGSTDGTSRLLADRLERQGDIRVVRHPQNRGYGAALATAFRETLSGDWDGLVTIDCDGQHQPRLIPAFTDFKRHDMGAALTGRADEGGVARSVWMTRRLWGLASTSPYLHDGSAMTFDEAIARHGGDAAQAQRAYALLDEGERTSVRIFLASLARAPSIRIR